MRKSSDNLFTAKEAAAYLRVSLETLYLLEAKRHIFSIRSQTGTRLYPTQQLRAYLNRKRRS